MHVRPHRLGLFGLAGLLTLASCTSEDSAASAPTTVPTSETTTTTAAPIVLATAEDLALPIGECWNGLAVATTVTTTAGSTATTLPTTTNTTTPTPEIVAIVDCAGTNQGEVYANFCIGLDPEHLDEVESASGALISDVLVRVPCPGDSELVWPGDRELRRAAARLCLEVFAVVFEETYAVSDRTAREITPNEGLWERSERRVVCSATEPPREVTTTTS